MLVNRRKKKEIRRNAVRVRVRRKLSGDPERPRLSVFRSNRHLHLQLIDDENGVTVASVSTLEPAFKELGFSSGRNVSAAAAAGKLLAERATAAGIQQAVFDRNGYGFHGRVQAVAKAARDAGLSF